MTLVRLWSHGRDWLNPGWGIILVGEETVSLLLGFSWIHYPRWGVEGTLWLVAGFLLLKEKGNGGRAKRATENT